LGLPLHVFPVGDPATSGDVAIEDVLAPRDAPAGGRVPIRVLLRNHGFRGRRVEGRIRPGAGPEGAAPRPPPLPPQEGPRPAGLVIEQGPAAQGLGGEVTPLPGEAVLENNQVAFQIRSRKRKTRVLYMEGTPSAEYRWVRDALIEDPDIECVALEVNNQYAV